MDKNGKGNGLGGFTVGTQPKTENIGMDHLQSLFKGMEESANTVRLSELEPGQYFQGLLYVKKSNIRQNKHNADTYDLRMLCVDGEGVIFTATCFNVKEKIEIENKVIVVTKGMKVETFQGATFYNIDKLTLYTGKDIPVTAFIKTIDTIDSYQTEYDKMMNRLAERKPTYSDLINEVNKKINFKVALSQSPYKTMMGNKLGSAMKMLVETVNLYEHLNTRVTPIKDDDLDFFTLVTSLYFIQPTIESYNMFHGTAFHSTTEDLTLPVEPFLMNLVYGSSLTKEEKTKILSILLQRRNHDEGVKPKGRFPLETTFFNVLSLMEEVIKLEELQ